MTTQTEIEPGYIGLKVKEDNPLFNLPNIAFKLTLTLFTQLERDNTIFMTPTLRNQIIDKLKISRNSYYKHMKIIVEKQLFLESEYKTIKLNKKYFVKGGDYKKTPVDKL